MGGRQCFIYDGVMSSQYGLWAGYVESSPNENNAIQTPYSYNFSISPSTHMARISSMQYEETFSFQMEIISDVSVSQEQERQIFRWLIDSPKFKRLEIFNYGNCVGYFERIHYNCILTDPKRIFGNGGIVGWTVTVLSNAPYAWADSKSYTYAAPLTQFVHSNLSDEPNYTYPAVEIVIGGSGGAITISNTTTTESFTVSETQAGETIRIDQYRQVTASNTENIYDKCKGKLRLIQGKNQFSVAGDVSRLTFYYADARKVGYN